MDEALVSEYLGSNRNDVPGLAAFNARVIPQELQARFAEARAQPNQLAQQGAATVPSILPAISRKLKQTHSSLSKNPMLSEGFTDAFLQAIFMNAIDLLVDIGGSSVQPLLTALPNTDPDIRALAAAFLGIKGIAGQGGTSGFQRSSNDPIEQAVRNVFLFDGDFVVRFAAAAALIQRGSSDRQTLDPLSNTSHPLSRQ